MFDAWFPLFAMQGLFCVIFLIDFITMNFDSLRLFKFVGKYKLWRSDVKERFLYLTGQSLSYSNTPVFVVSMFSFVYYWWVGVFSHEHPKAQLKNVLEVRKNTNQTGSQVYDEITGKMVGKTIIPFKGSYGSLTESQIRYMRLKVELLHE